MKLEVESTEDISGKVAPSPSKFQTQFASAVALLADGKSEINSPLLVDNTRNLLKNIEDMGATVKRNKERWSIWGSEGGLNPSGQVIDAKKSVMSLSLLTSISALASRVMVVTGKSQIRTNPVPSLLKALHSLGVDVHSTNSDDSPPLVIFESDIEGGKTSLEEETDPRFIPAFLLLIPFSKDQVELELIPEFKTALTRGAVSIMEKSGIEVSTTQRRLRVSPGEYGSFSFEPPLDLFSTFPFVSAAVMTGSELRISKVSRSENVEEFTSLLEKMGVDLKKTSRSVWIKPSQQIKSRRYSLSEFPELAPFAAVLACAAEGKTRIINAERARHMKSDRISAMVEGLGRMGADIEEEKDGFVVDGPAELKGTEVDGYDDDAVVAALSVAGFSADGKTIVRNRAETLRESYTHFVSTFQNLGANIGYKS